MENLIFSLNATIPIFLMMVLGVFFRKTGLLKENMINGLNQFVFKATLPVLLFGDLAKQDFAEAWNGKFVAFCFVVTLVSISLVALMSMALKDKSQRGEFIQGAYRSSAAILGIAFITNIYGNSGMAPLMIIGSVPLYNIMAVVVLSFTKPGQNGMSPELIKKTLKGIATNPIILGILAGVLWSVLRLPMPTILTKTVSSLGGLTTPLGLMAMGAAFNWSEAKSGMGPAFAASFMKLIGLCTLFLPVAVLLGFREAELIAILVMLGSSTTVSSYVMARNMGHSGVLSSSIVAITTLGSAFSLTFWLYVLKTLALI
ncbi:AEC family transporter [Clostridium sp. AM33-3]|uniref:AEC family transporter n=1 Tax=Clostridium sp. AM33-3 TaxID=2292304 RepID=UPI000E4865DB|nr:AEC family transporter [Clostridium sp. AM33-3]RHT24219.1 AEC family transporter [Clostridium sp. AM33-3]